MPQLDNTGGCTLETCPLSMATVHYDPSLAGNTFYLLIFALLLSLQALQLWLFRTWSFSLSVMAGLVLEVAGYIGRIQMHYNPFDANPFLTYLICLTIGPVFFSAAIYLTLSRIIVHYGQKYSWLSPKTISITFMFCDFISLVLQAAGGAIADTANTKKESNTGVHIMVAGLAFQVLSLLLFICTAGQFALAVRKSTKDTGVIGIHYPRQYVRAQYSDRRSTASFNRFLFALSFATICILVRSAFRVGELAKGFDSKLANDQITFMVLEGAMIVSATVIFTIFHPGFVFGDDWKNSGWDSKENGQSDHESFELHSWDFMKGGQNFSLGSIAIKRTVKVHDGEESIFGFGI